MYIQTEAKEGMDELRGKDLSIWKKKPLFMWIQNYDGWEKNDRRGDYT